MILAALSGILIMLCFSASARAQQNEGIEPDRPGCERSTFECPACEGCLVCALKLLSAPCL